VTAAKRRWLDHSIMPDLSVSRGTYAAAEALFVYYCSFALRLAQGLVGRSVTKNATDRRFNATLP
jgi:hypothetical protein